MGFKDFDLSISSIGGNAYNFIVTNISGKKITGIVTILVNKSPKTFQVSLKNGNTWSQTLESEVKIPQMKIEYKSINCMNTQYAQA